MADSTPGGDTERFSAPALPDPEREWSSPVGRVPDPAAVVEARLGAVGEPLAPLPGGRANLNIRIGRERVLRVYLRDPAASGKERSLLQRDWRHLRVPRVLDGGPDFLLLEWLRLRPLRDDAAHGAAVGRAAAEIHGHRPGAHGFLDAELAVREPLPNARTYVERRVDALGPDREELGEVLLRVTDGMAEDAELWRTPVLNHGDFKPSNLFAGPAGEVVALDWEFAFAGPALMDVGQLFRWSPSDAFRKGFVRGYEALGGPLPRGWRRRAAALDLVNLLALASRPGHDPRRIADVRGRIRATLEMLGP